jgi:glycerate kinase
VVYVQKERVAVIEVAAVCGLHLKRPEDDALLLHTRGVGRLAKQILATGVSDLYLALGGTGTTDGGLGLLAELGAHLLTKTGRPVAWQTNPLLETERIILPSPIVSLHVLADVTAVYAGTTGAAHVFGPQKGLTAQQIKLLDARLSHLGQQLGVEHVAGAGAAGAVGLDGGDRRCGQPGVTGQPQVVIAGKVHQGLPPPLNGGPCPAINGLHASVAIGAMEGG